MKAASLFVLMTALALPLVAQAGTSFLVSSPVLEHDEIVLMLGGLSEDGVALKPTSVQVEIDGAPAAPPRVEPLFERAESAGERSPLAVGLTYLWIKEVPSAMSDALLEGVTGFCRRLPNSTPVRAVLYGRKRQPIPKLKASELASDLHDVGFLAGDRPNLADAIRLAIKALSSEESPLKILLLATDGRDFADPTGEAPADFAGLADELTRARIPLLLVSFPGPEVDAAESARNLAALAGTGLQRTVEQPAELQNTLESLGQTVADMRLVRLAIPWTWRTWGGTHRLRLNVQNNGKSRALDVGKISLPAARWPWFLLAGVFLGALLVVGMLLRARRPRGHGESLLDAVSELIERGVSARQALATLSRRFPKEVAHLAAVDLSTLADSGYPILQTKAGRRRFEEIVALLARSDDAAMDDDLAAALAQAIGENLPAERAAARLGAQIPEDELARFSRLDLQALAGALRKASARHPILAAPRSRAQALAIQEAIRLPQASANAVGWLVRAAGPGRRGETLSLRNPRAVLGRASGCDLRLDADAQVAQEHAVIAESHGQFTIEPLQGLVKVEAVAVTSRHPLHDGDTLEMGESRFVWKCVGR